MSIEEPVRRDDRSTVETPRLLLRPVEPADSEAFVDFYGCPEVMAIRKFGVMDRPRALEAVDTILRHRETHGFGLWAVIEKSTGAFAGECGLRWVEDGSDVEVSYGLLPAFRGRGHATEAAAAALAYGFDTLGLTRIVALSRGDNRASHRVLEKCGMRLVERVDRGPHGVVRYLVEAPRS